MNSMLRPYLWPLFAGIVAFVGVYFASAQLGADSSTLPATQASPLADWLGADSTQRRQLAELEANFGAEREVLAERFLQAKDKLAGMLEHPGSTDADVLQASEQVIAAKAELDRRITQHLLAVRKQLTPQQQRDLMQLCARGVRERGEGWGRQQGPQRGKEGMRRHGRANDNP